jgi:hypothetical protein
MQRNYVFGTVRDTRRNAIYVIRVRDDVIDPIEADEIFSRIRSAMFNAAISWQPIALD